MRILKVTQAYHPFLSRGGPAIKVRSIARELVRLGQQVTVLTADLGFGPAEVRSAAAVRNDRAWRSQLDGVDAIYLKTRCHYRNLTINPSVIAFCRHRLRGFDVVHAYGLYDALGAVVARYCRQYGIPYFVEPLGMTRLIDRGFALKKLWKTLASNFMSGACKLIATSELERSELLAEGFPPDRVVLRYNGIDLGDFRDLPAPGTFRSKLGLREGERYILFLGRVIPRKGADLLIEAMQHLPEAVKLVIAGPQGESGYLDMLRGQARALGIQRRVVFAGPLYRNDHKAAMVDAWVFALPSRYENFGNTAAEAVACCTPAIVSDRCGIAPLIGGRAGLAVPYGSEGVASAVMRLLADPPLYQRLKLGCPVVAEELSWSGLIRQLLSLYQQADKVLSPVCAESVA